MPQVQYHIYKHWPLGWGAYKCDIEQLSNDSQK